MSEITRVLLVEDDPADARLVHEMLRCSDATAGCCELVRVASLAEALERLSVASWDAVLLDLGLPESVGLDTLRRLLGGGVTLPSVVVLSGLGDEDVAVQALQAGARDYLIKGEMTGPLLQRALRYAIGRSRAEQALRDAMQRAESANEAKSRFLANVSHELRTPLSGILGLSQLLQADATLDDRPRHHAEVIEQCGQHLLTLINDLLDLAKVEAGRFEMDVGDVDLHALVGVVADLIQVRASAKPALGFYCLVDPAVPERIRIDEQRLRQVLLNLLDNAVKFTDHGAVTLWVRPAAGGRLRFDIDDSGTTLGDGELSRLFQPFEQVGDMRRRKMGTGLGLTIARELVRLMGGDIRVEPGLGCGNRFWFEVDAPPVAAMPAPAAPPDAAPALAGAA